MDIMLIIRPKIYCGYIGFINIGLKRSGLIADCSQSGVFTQWGFRDEKETSIPVLLAFEFVFGIAKKGAYNWNASIHTP